VILGLLIVVACAESIGNENSMRFGQLSVVKFVVILKEKILVKGINFEFMKIFSEWKF
jgi:hypothetical protein